MDQSRDKDLPILVFLSRLEKSIGSSGFVVTDHWENDLTAIGVSSPNDADILAYVSCFNKVEGHYNYELELPAVPATEMPYTVAGRGSDVPLDELIRIVTVHLAQTRK
jgi:hypothetical protein